MDTRTDEIADGNYRVSLYSPHVASPAGLTYNVFLISGDEPLLFHTGKRSMFPDVAAAVARVLPLKRLRWIAFGHYEADECGAMNEFLAAAPRAEIAHGNTACRVSLNDMAHRPPRALADGETIELGRGLRVRYVDTPHIPHGWEAGVLYEEQSGTLLCGDLFTQTGNAPAMTGEDIVGPAIAAEDLFRFSSLHPSTGRTMRKLATLAPRMLALMHGPAFSGDCTAALHALAGDYDRRIRALLDG
ncbi:MAG TPA: MBL fold metallo-hydrolase [Acetobacteraceae bacterium]